jgi:hypothetical protein
MDVKIKKIRNEFEFKNWFEKNFKKLGYSRIIKKDTGKFPDFIMLKNNEKINVELETLSSNFILHNHDKSKIDEIVCIKKDIDINIPILEIKELKYVGGKKRASFTVDKKTVNIINLLLKDGKFRNRSHLIETAIKLIEQKENDKKK